MSISIIQSPQAVAFSGCRNIFRIQSSDHVLPGTNARISFTIDTAQSAPGDIVTLRVDSLTINYIFDNPDSQVYNPAIGPNYRFTTAQELFQRINSTHYLSGFTITGQSEAATGAIRVVIESSTPGHHMLSISSINGVVSLSGTLSDGSDTERIRNYRVATRFQVRHADTTVYTPWCYFVPNGNITTVDTSILSSYLHDPTACATPSDFSLQSIDTPLFSYRLQVSEVYGDNPVIQQQVTSSWLLMMAGEVSQAMADALLPDWRDASPSASMLSRLIVFGSDTGRTLTLFRNQLDYLYLVSFSADTTATAVVTVYSESQGQYTYRRPLTIARDTFYALPINPALMGATTANCTISLTILNSAGASIFTRNYTLQHSSPGTVQIYYADKYGLLRSFVAASLQRSVNFEADDLIISRARTQQVTKRTETFTVTTLPLTESDADALVDSLAFDKLYIRHSGNLYAIHVSPSSFLAYSTDQNLTVVTFDMFVHSHQLHPMPRAFRLDPTSSPFDTKVYIPDYALLSEDNLPLASELLEILTAQ